MSELLNKLLELAESNMNENEYVQVADILKKIYDCKPDDEGFITLSKPFTIYYDGDDGGDEQLFQIISYKKNERIENTTYKIKYDDHEKIFKHREMLSFIRYKLETVCITDFAIDSNWLEVHQFITYRNFSNAYKTCHCDSDCEDKMDKYDEIITKYVDIIYTNWQNCIKD